MKSITYTAYLMFLFIGYIFTVAGVIPQDIAETFGVKDADVVFVFTFFIVGTTSAIFLNGILLDKLTSKQESYISFMLIAIGIIGMISANSIYIFTFFLIINGLGVGLLVSFGNYLIINMYESERAKKLNILNFYYSLGAVTGPFIAGYILKYGKNVLKYEGLIKRVWIYIYFIGIIFLVLIFILLITRDYTVLKKQNKIKIRENIKEKWSISVYIIATAIFLYVMSEMTITYWIVTYLKEKSEFSIVAASQILAVIWFFMMLGRFLSGKAVDYIKSEKYIILLGSIAAIGVFILMHSTENLLLWIAAAITGIGYSGMYATILTYGTEQLKRHSNKLMTFYITCGSAGGIVATPLSSFIKKNFGITAAITVSFISITTVVLLIFLTVKINKENKI